MSDRARRAGSYGRATGEALLDELAAESGELAKRWAIALIESARASELGAIDLASIASEGPELIETLLGGETRPGRLARIAGSDAGELARASEALRRVLWEAAVEAVPRARSDTRAARRLLETGEEVAVACAQLLAAELDRAGVERMPEAGGPSAAASPVRTRSGTEQIVIVDERSASARQGHGEPAMSGPPAGPEPQSGPPVPLSGPPEPESGPPVPLSDTREPQSDPREPQSGPPVPWPAEAAPEPLAAPPPFAPSIAAREARQGPAAWIRSIGGQLRAFEQDHRCFSVLLIEMLEPSAALDAEAATHALQERLGQWRGLTLTREGPGRYWLLAPGADRAGAESLRDLVSSPRGEARGGPVAVGIALCPEDGSDAAGLAAHADLDLYASRSRSEEGPAGRS